MPKSIARNSIFYALIVISLMVLLGLNIHLRPDADDQFFLKMTNEGILNALHNRYSTWSGRLIIELILLATIKYSFFWRIAIPASTLLLCYTIAKMANINNRLYITMALTIALGLTMKFEVIKDSILWVTGYYNYLLPVSLGFFSLWQATVSSATFSKSQYVALFCSFIYSYSEQVAVFSICFLIYLASLKNIGNKRFIVTLLTITLINFLICYFAPGNKARASVEAWFAFPQFLSLNIFQKISLGFICFYKHVSDKKNILYQVLILMCVAFSFKNRNGITSYLSAFFITAHLLLVYLGNKFSINLYSNANFDGYFWVSYRSFLSVAISLMAFISVIFILFNCRHVRETNISWALLGCGAITVIAMGLSPTVFGSGERIYFIFDCVILYSLVLIINNLLPRYFSYEKHVKAKKMFKR